MSDYLSLGQAAIQNKNFTEAEHWFSLAVQETPKDPQIRACLGQTFCWQGKLNEGLAQLRQAGQLLFKKARKSRDITLLLDLAEQLQYWNDYQGAAELCKQAVQINPQEVRAFQLLALSHSRLNQNKLALAAGRQALKLVPGSAMLEILLATLEIADKQSEAARQRLEKVLQNPLLKAEERFRAHKELARVLDKLEIYDQVFPNLHASGQVAARLPEVQRQDANFVPKLLERYQTEFDEALLSRWRDADFSNDPTPPVFVMGFMRTGTTLTQEVLGAHPKVLVADETDLIMATANELKRLCKQKGSVPEMLQQLDWEGVRHLRAFYWQRALSLFGDTLGDRVFLDKTTMNSIDLGLIHCLFPDAKLIFLLRDPRDVCLSCIMQTMTPNPSTVHLLTWENTARFYAQVMQWWTHIKPRLTMAFMELRYEDAVFEFEPTFRQVFDFLGLEWNPEVADFHKHAAGKVIASPSFNQVAQPLYSSSVGRWRHYAAEYPSVSTWLQPFIDAYGYS